MSDQRPRAARYRYEQAVDRAIHAIAAQRLAETTTIRRYVEYLAEPVGDFADAGPGYYLLEDRETPTGTEYGLIVAGPIDGRECDPDADHQTPTTTGVVTMDKIERFRGTDGTLIAYVWPGGYPVAYLTAWDNVLCPTCANAWQDDEAEPLAYGFIHREGSSHYCDECSAEIKSAYGDPDAEQEG